MAGAEWLLETVLVLLLGATLFHALRLERALGVLKRDRAVLEELVEGFNDSTRQAESGVERLRAAADGAGRQMARQIETAQRLRDDLTFLSDRSEKLAERLENAVRGARMLPEAVLVQGAIVAASTQAATAPQAAVPHAASVTPAASQPASAPPPNNVPHHVPHDGIEHERKPSLAFAVPPRQAPIAVLSEPEAEPQAPRLRSQAERDLLRALRGGR
jgi:hypothetical protein